MKRIDIKFLAVCSFLFLSYGFALATDNQLMQLTGKKVREPELEYMQGEWQILKWTSPGIGAWDQEDGDAMIGKRLYIEGDRVAIYFKGQKYPGRLGNIKEKKFLRLGQTDAFDENDGSPNHAERIGLTNDLAVENLELDGEWPFGFWILIWKNEELLFCEEGTEFLMKRVGKSGLVIEQSNPDVDKAWRTIIDHNNTDKAIRIFRQVIAKDPRNAEAYFGLGHCYQHISWEDREKFPNLAISYYQKALQLAPLDEDISKAAKINIDHIMVELKWPHYWYLPKTPVTPVER